MKNEEIKKSSVKNVAKQQLQFPAIQRKVSAAPKKTKYVYTEKDLGEGLLYMGLSKTAYFAAR